MNTDLITSRFPTISYSADARILNLVGPHDFKVKNKGINVERVKIVHTIDNPFVITSESTFYLNVGTTTSEVVFEWEVNGAIESFTFKDEKQTLTSRLETKAKAKEEYEKAKEEKKTAAHSEGRRLGVHTVSVANPVGAATIMLRTISVFSSTLPACVPQRPMYGDTPAAPALDCPCEASVKVDPKMEDGSSYFFVNTYKEDKIKGKSGDVSIINLTVIPVESAFALTTSKVPSSFTQESLTVSFRARGSTDGPSFGDHMWLILDNSKSMTSSCCVEQVSSQDATFNTGNPETPSLLEMGILCAQARGCHLHVIVFSSDVSYTYFEPSALADETPASIASSVSMVRCGGTQLSLVGPVLREKMGLFPEANHKIVLITDMSTTDGENAPFLGDIKKAPNAEMLTFAIASGYSASADAVGNLVASRTGGRYLPMSASMSHHALIRAFQGALDLHLDSVGLEKSCDTALMRNPHLFESVVGTTSAFSEPPTAVPTHWELPFLRMVTLGVYYNQIVEQESGERLEGDAQFSLLFLSLVAVGDEVVAPPPTPVPAPRTKSFRTQMCGAGASMSAGSGGSYTGMIQEHAVNCSSRGSRRRFQMDGSGGSTGFRYGSRAKGKKKARKPVMEDGAASVPLMEGGASPTNKLSPLKKTKFEATLDFTSFFASLALKKYDDAFTTLVKLLGDTHTIIASGDWTLDQFWEAFYRLYTRNQYQFPEKTIKELAEFSKTNLTKLPALKAVFSNA